MRRLCQTLALLFLISRLPAQAADLRLALAVEPDSIDPHVHNFGGNKAFMPNLFETLTAIDANGRLAPGLATDWTLENDTTWDITLRPDVSFSDGGEVHRRGRRLHACSAWPPCRPPSRTFPNT